MRSIHSEEAQISDSESQIKTPRGSCGSSSAKKRPFMKNDELFAKEIHYRNVPNFSEKNHAKKDRERSYDVTNKD